MWLVDRLKEAVGITAAPPPPSKPVREAASAQSTDEPGWRRLSGDGLSDISHRSDEGHRTGDAGARRALSQALAG